MNINRKSILVQSWKSQGNHGIEYNHNVLRGKFLSIAKNVLNERNVSVN
jgi:hypothetical protein